jgi:hypothetical protein
MHVPRVHLKPSDVSPVAAARRALTELVEVDVDLNPEHVLEAGHGARFSAEIYTRGCHWIPREANTRVTNGIPLGSSLLLPVDTVNCVQTLKAVATAAR